MITQPIAELENLAYELLRWKRFNATPYDMAQARTDASDIIDALAVTPFDPEWTAMHHPLTPWVANHFGVHWKRAGYALITVLEGGDTPAFHALAANDTDYEVEGVLVGTGDLTEARTSSIYLPDHEDVYREFGSAEAGYQGGRVVRNYCRNNDKITANSWNSYLCSVLDEPTELNPFGEADGVWRITGTGSLWSLRQEFLSAINGNGLTVSIWVKTTDGGTRTFRIHAGSSSTDLTATGTWQRFTVHADGDFNDPVVYPIMRNSSNDLTDFFIYYPQIEVTGTSDIPGEEVLTGSSSDTSVRWRQRIFANQNGNTVLNNVVTEAVGAPLAEAPWLYAAPAMTNSLLYSRDLTNAAWTTNSAPSSKSYDQVGLTGEPNTATLISDNSASQIQFLGQTVIIPADTNTHTVVFYVDKSTDVTSFPLIFTQTGGGNTSTIQWNQDTGAWAYHPSDVQAAPVEVIDGQDWWIIMLQSTNDSSADMLIRLYPSISLTLGGTSDVSATGTIIVGNVELHLNKTIAEVKGASPIFTTTASVSVDATATSVQAANNDDANRGWYVEAKNIPRTITANRNSEVGFLRTSTDVRGNVLTYDHVNSTSAVANMRDIAGNKNSLSFSIASRDTVYKFGCIYNSTDNKKNVRADPISWNADSTYTGFWSPTSPLKIGVPVNFVCLLRNLRGYDGTYGQNQDSIDGLMS